MTNPKSYTLKNKDGSWLGQVVLTEDGMFSAVTDYGNFAYAWRHCGKDFRKFILELNIDYFADKMYWCNRNHRKCLNFSKHILPVLQDTLKEEIYKEELIKSWPVGCS